MRRNLEWIEGAPESFVPGMVVQWIDGCVTLIGSNDVGGELLGTPLRHAYAIKPHELQWIEDMVNRSNKSRGEQE